VGTTVCFLGLGNMGLPMAVRLQDAGFRVRGFDPAAVATRAATEAGLDTAPDLTTVVAGAGVILLMLPSSDVVEAVLADPAVRPVLGPGVTVLDMSSSDPVRTRALAAAVAQTGAALVDAPVSGGVAGATAGSLTIMAGGAPEAVDRVEPLLTVLGTLRRTGPVGSGHALKALNNLLSATHLLVSSEAILAGQRFGLDPEVMLEVINSSSGRSFSTEYKWPTFVRPETYDSGFALRLLVKDATIAVELARAVGLPSRLGEAALELWREAAELLPPDADHTEIARFANLPYAAAAARA
jgi:3-hydroxyisobutyrate dehydrogenase